MQAAYKNQRDQIEHLEAFINRFRAQATKAKQVQSRIKELEKIERIEIPEEEPVIHFKFPQPPPSGRIVVEAEGLAKSYGEKQVFKNVRFTIERGDRVALVGVNGAGKSTLIKLLTAWRRRPPARSSSGHNVVSEYFAQDQYKVLDGDARMLDDMSRAAPKGAGIGIAVPARVLSVFRRRCVQAARACSPAASATATRWRASSCRRPISCSSTSPPTTWTCAPRTCCSKPIAAFSGTVIFVSHDRYFIDRLATRVLEVENGSDHHLSEVTTKTICARRKSLPSALQVLQSPSQMRIATS